VSGCKNTTSPSSSRLVQSARQAQDLDESAFCVSHAPHQLSRDRGRAGAQDELCTGGLDLRADPGEFTKDKVRKAHIVAFAPGGTASSDAQGIGIIGVIGGTPSPGASSGAGAGSSDVVGSAVCPL
jgi:hypothetical protein